jgi:hypothetical protein
MGNIVGFWTKSTWAAVALKPLFGPFVEMWGPGILSFGGISVKCFGFSIKCCEVLVAGHTQAAHTAGAVNGP